MCSRMVKASRRDTQVLWLTRLMPTGSGGAFGTDVVLVCARAPGAGASTDALRTRAVAARTKPTRRAANLTAPGPTRAARPEAA